MDADSTVNNSDDSIGPASEDPPSARLLANVPRPPRPARRSSGVGVAVATAGAPGSGPRRTPVEGALNAAKEADDDGWSTDAGESATDGAAPADDRSPPPALERGALERGIFGDNDDESDSFASPPAQAPAMKDVASAAPPVSVDEAEGRPARFPSQAPNDAPEEAPLLAQLSQAALRTPTKIQPPLGSGREEESWPTNDEVAEASPGVPVSDDGGLDEHEATVVGNVSKDILELASKQEAKTNVFHAPRELIDLARRKRDESRARRERDLDTVKPDAARAAAKAQSPMDDMPTPVPLPVASASASDAAPAVTSESAPPVARGVARAVETLRAEDAKRAQESANPRIEIRAVSPESMKRAEQEFLPQSEGLPAAEPAPLSRHWVSDSLRWLPLIVCCVLIGYFVVRLFVPLLP